jgi:hypothetical protein
MGKLYMPINELIFAPVNAIKEADISLSNGILKQIAIFSDTENKDTDTPTMKLKNIKFLYDKIKSDENEERIETVGLTVPAASIIPLSALQINSSTIKFNIEVKYDYDKNNDFSLIGKNAPEIIRKSDFLPKIHFKIKTESTTIPEGVARLIDILDTNQIPSVENKIYVNQDCLPYKNQNIHSLKNNTIFEINKLNIIIDKINKFIISLDKELKSKTGECHQEYSVSKEHSSEADKLYNKISKLKDNLNKYNIIKNEKENDLLNIEIDILEDNISYG